MPFSFLFLILVNLSQSVFAMNSNLLSGPVFKDLCASGVQKVENGWNYNRPQMAYDDQNLYFTKNLIQESQQTWIIKHTDNGKDSNLVISFDQRIRDILLIGENLWVLFDNSIVIVDRNSGALLKTLQTTANPITEAFHERAFEMTSDSKNIYVAQGSLGLSIIDIQNQKFIKTMELGLRSQKEGHISKAVGVTQQNGDLYVAVDSVTMPSSSSKAFNGFLTAKANNLETYTQFTINDKSSGPITMVMSSQVSNGKLILNNWGLMQTAPLSAFKKPGKEITLSTIPVQVSHLNQSYPMDFLGDISLDEKNFYACGKISPDDMVNHIPIRVGVVHQGLLK